MANKKTTAEGRRESNISKATFLKLLKKLADTMQANRNESLKSGFKKCGIAPYNPDAVLDRLPKHSDETKNQDEPNTSDIVDSLFMSILEDVKRGLDAPATRKRNKRLKVPPGKSVAHHSEEVQQRENNQEGGIEASEQNDNQIPGPNHQSKEAQCGENSQEDDRDDNERT